MALSFPGCKRCTAAPYSSAPFFTSLPLFPPTHPTQPNPQEPEFFSDTCGYDPGACPPKEAKDYLWRQLRLGEYLAAGGAKAAMEASTHYGREGVVLAPRLVKVRWGPLGAALLQQAAVGLLPCSQAGSAAVNGVQNPDV